MGNLTQQIPLPGKAGAAWGTEELAAQWPCPALPGNCLIDPNPNLQRAPPIDALHSLSDLEFLKVTMSHLRGG